MPIHDPFHEGELAVQARADEREIGARNGRVISDTILSGAIPFLARQTTLVIGSLDGQQRPWASLLFGAPGFVVATDERTVEVDRGTATVPEADELWQRLSTDPRIGMLAIDLANRRRLRINGHATMPGPATLRVEVRESYPNCPKYIQRRHAVPRIGTPEGALPTRAGAALDEPARALVTRADTLFVASAHPGRGVDASHRGGDPGFVRVLDDGRLRIPDYAGNSMFNTLGNLAVHSQAGIVVPDFTARRTLQIVGTARILHDADDPDNHSGGTRRFWDLHVDEWIEAPMPAAVSWELLDRSPNNPRPRA